LFLGTLASGISDAKTMVSVDEMETAAAAEAESDEPVAAGVGATTEESA
jgi:hypothetical protein